MQPFVNESPSIKQTPVQGVQGRSSENSRIKFGTAPVATGPVKMGAGIYLYSLNIFKPLKELRNSTP